MEDDYDAQLELGLGSSRWSPSSANSYSARPARVADWFGNEANQRNQQQQQQITIFYNGKICVCDATEMQARAIICMARKETEEKLSAEEKKHHHGNDAGLSPRSTSSSSQSRPLSPPQLINLGLSMKRSLQRFLQKRKTRMDDASPYGRRPN